jgi:hypothetical protein
MVLPTKNIETLVADIYDLFSKSDWKPDVGTIQSFGQRLAEHVANRASEERGAPTLRLSNLGVPDRKLWYTINVPEKAEPLPPEARIKFLFGDILEELLLFLAKEAGHDVTGQQDEIEINGVKGHRDAIIDGRVVDCKSASSYSFRKFEANGLRSDDPFGYLNQLGSYLAGSSDASERDVASFLVIDKTLGKITLDTYPKDDTDYEKLVEHKRKVISLPKPPEEKCYPEEPEGKSGNRKLGTGCSYCPFKHECWPGLRTFIYSTGPTFLTKVVKEPKVVEVNRNGDVVHKFQMAIVDRSF